MPEGVRNLCARAIHRPSGVDPSAEAVTSRYTGPRAPRKFAVPSATARDARGSDVQERKG